MLDAVRHGSHNARDSAKETKRTAGEGPPRRGQRAEVEACTRPLGAELSSERLTKAARTAGNSNCAGYLAGCKGIIKELQFL